MAKSAPMTLKPRMSEKAYAISKQLNTYVFVVPKNANKVTVAAAVEADYKVEVVSVNIGNVSGKVKRSYRRGGRPIVGQDRDVKKAYVRIKDGQQIPIFAAIDEEEAKAAKTAEQVEKAAAKRAKKEGK